MDAVELRGVQPLEEHLVRITRGVGAVNRNIARRVNELQVKQGKQFVKFQAGLLKKDLDVRQIAWNGGLAPEDLLPRIVIHCRKNDVLFIRRVRRIYRRWNGGIR